MFRRFWRRLQTTIIDTAEFWWLPFLLGAVTAGIVWAVWYLSKVPCTLTNAVDYQCNPSAIANFIDVDVLSRCITLGAIVATLAGGFNIYMFAKEREARIDAESRLAAERKSKDELLEELRAELREERRRADEHLAEERRRAEDHLAEERRHADERLTGERRRADERLTEERRRADETQQVMLAAIADLTGKIADLVERNNGNGRQSG